MNRFLLLVSILLAAYSGPTAPPRETEPGNLMWEGHVTSAVDGTPIPDIGVGLFHFATDGTLYYWGGATLWAARTSSNGYYRIDGSLLSASARARENDVFLQARCNLHTPGGDECEFEDWQESERVYVSFDEGVHVIDLQLTPR